MTALNVVQTGERDFCFIGEWTGWTRSPPRGRR